MKLLYFAWVRQKVGKSQEDFQLPETVRTAEQLRLHLVARGGGYAEALSDSKRIKLAINLEHCAWDTALSASDEVALFPPVTGG